MTTNKTAQRRFYEHAESAPSDDGYVVALDGRAVKTPLGYPLVLPNAALAKEVAAEWEAQEEKLRPDTMPLTQLSITALDRMTKDRDDVVAALAAYATTDLLCYRAEAPSDLVARQAAAWQPLLDWVAESYGAALTVTAGIIPVDQPASSLDALRGAVEQLSPFELAVLGTVTPMAGSLVLGLALLSGRLDGDGVVACAFVDEDYQAELWGDDDEAVQRRAHMINEIKTAERLMHLVREGSS